MVLFLDGIINCSYNFFKIFLAINRSEMVNSLLEHDHRNTIPKGLNGLQNKGLHALTQVSWTHDPTHATKGRSGHWAGGVAIIFALLTSNFNPRKPIESICLKLKFNREKQPDLMLLSLSLPFSQQLQKTKINAVSDGFWLMNSSLTKHTHLGIYWGMSFGHKQYEKVTLNVISRLFL